MRNLTAAIAASVLVTAAGLGAASPGLAQTPPRAIQAAGPGGGAAPDAADRRAMARVEQHITDLHKRLAITAAQQPQWDAFTKVMRENAQAMEQRYKERQAKGSQGALDDMRDYAAAARLHADAMARLLPPFETLYASMTPEQKLAADKTFQNFERNQTRRGGT